MALTVIALTIAATTSGSAQSADPLSDGARFNYGIIKDFVTRAAAKMPVEHYPFRPTQDVRSFGELIGHLADANYRLCSAAAKENQPRDDVEKTETTPASLIKALADSFAYCDGLYSAITDAASAEVVGLEVGGEGARVPIELPKLSVLAFHTQHAFEHYGNIVTYMRLKGLVPPSSEPRTAR